MHGRRVQARELGALLRIAGPSAHTTALLLSALVACTTGCSRTRGADDRFGPGPGPGPERGEDGGLLCARECDDAVLCNGQERCDPQTGQCVAGEPEDCDDGDECTIDACEPERDRCTHTQTPRDRDQDGFDACVDDCDDDDSAINPAASERCDGVDDDCDGRVDEGLTSACGDCRPGCRLLYIPERGAPWRPDPTNSDAVSVREGEPSGPLVLDAERSQRFDAFIANSGSSKVTKLDTRDGRQLARYDSVLLDGSNGAPSPDLTCDASPQSRADANCPSRTAVDAQGSVYVANRAFGQQGTVTKIAGFPEDCVDRDGDGAIQTSRDLDGNGQIDRFVPGEFLGQADECLLWTVDVGERDAVPRALAVDAEGHVWVGLHREQAVVELDPRDGRVLRSIRVPGFQPYGAAIDGRNGLWLTQALSGLIVRVDTVSGAVGRVLEAPAPNADCPSSYGVAIDDQDRVWVAGFSCPFAFRYDPRADAWLSVALPGGGVTRGIAADDRGRVYVASSHGFIALTRDPTFGYFFDTGPPHTRLTVFDADDGGELRVLGTTAEPLPGAGAIGVGLDDQRRVWLINQDSGSATRLDLEQDEVDHFPAGDLPYTYSDFTGFAQRRITAPSGYIRERLRGCERGPSEWEELRVEAELPEGSRIEVRVRSAATERELEAATFSEARTEARQALGHLPRLPWLEVEARLVSANRRSSPALQRIVVQLHCPSE